MKAQSQNLQNNVVQRDREIVWHPFTQEKTEQLPIEVVRGDGAYLIDKSGKKYLDLISSWWVNIHGHANAKIANSIANQASTLEHVMFAGFTHEPAVRLCEMINEILPPTLSKFFFSDNGSTSVEIALKMALQYWHNKGEGDRKLFISFECGYHGDTFGAMSVGKSSGFHDPFKSMMFNVLQLPFPATWNGDINVESKEAECLQMLHQYLESNSKQIAAFILEPIIQGAAGMRMCRPEFLHNILSILRWHNILIIFDEVMTGFGRTGKNFAFENIGIEPDFICLSKAITGGFLPLGLTVTSNKIYDAFYSDDWGKAFTHGHSYTANPIACSAGVASLELLLQESTQKSIQAICNTQVKGLEYLNNKCDNIKNLRSFGTIIAFEVDLKIRNLEQILRRKFLESGMLIRPIGKTVYLIPPYCVDVSELEKSYKKIAEVLNKI